MKTTVLTSSRADFGIQLPLLRALRNDRAFGLSLIAFGSHADERYGHTLDEIIAHGYAPDVVLPPTLERDDAHGIALSMGRTMEQFANVWSRERPDLVVALGDRYEMFSAVAAAMPFGIRIAHIHGGETTIGAIDNAFRHSITHMAHLHFTAAEPYRERVMQLIGSDHQVLNTGALSIDNIQAMQLLEKDEIKARTRVDMERPTVLVTVHPETVNVQEADQQWLELSAVLTELSATMQLLVTLPNADTGGTILRNRLIALSHALPSMTTVNSLGSLGYLSCMKHCTFMLGNSSSGYVEASFFNKRVIDIGDRQTGRYVTANIIRSPYQRDAILRSVRRALYEPPPAQEFPYGDGHAAERMVAQIQALR
jgi:GDP/UDP-N,N'-diacetylbacillosamine 2-epimerase (hydrolysing)